MRSLRAGRLLFAKDLRVLVRSRGLLAILIGYPVIIAILLAIALSGGDRRPSVAFVNLDAGSGRTVLVGNERLSVSDYVSRIQQDVDLKHLDPAQAEQVLRDGKVAAILTIPQGFVADLASALQSPVITLQTNPRNPIEAQAVERNMEAAVFRLNQALATAYVDQVLNLVKLIQDGGSVSLFGRSGRLDGLKRNEQIVQGMQRALRAAGQPAEAAKADSLVAFISGVGDNLNLAKPAARSIASPIRLDIRSGTPGREPLSALGIAGALVVGLGLLSVLLAAALLSAEREDGTMSRLGRGLVGPGAMITQKAVVSAVATLVVGMVLLGIVAVATSVTVGRWVIWVLALVVAGLAFGAFGLLIGALARETRTALLASLMITLPLAVVALIPGNEVAYWVSAVAGFGPAARVFQQLLVDPTVSGSLWAGIGLLAGIALAYGVVARLVLGRRMHSA